MNMYEAEERLGLTFGKFESDAVPISQMLADTKKPESKGLGGEQVKYAKEKTFDDVVEIIEVNGYPTEANEHFEKANVDALVLRIIFPIFVAFKRATGRYLFLRRDKEIFPMNPKTRRGNFQEFVCEDLIGIGDRKFIFLVKTTKSSIGEAKRECMLALKDMGDRNGGGFVYGFVASGEFWQVIRYDGSVFTQTRPIPVLFPAVEREKEMWLKESSVIVDCIHTALKSGGFASVAE